MEKINEYIYDEDLEEKRHSDEVLILQLKRRREGQRDDFYTEEVIQECAEDDELSYAEAGFIAGYLAA